MGESWSGSNSELPHMQPPGSRSGQIGEGRSIGGSSSCSATLAGHSSSERIQCAIRQATPAIGHRIIADAALSSRQEVYSRGMPPLRALKLSQGALYACRCLRCNRFRSRGGPLPRCQPLPERPELDDLLSRRDSIFSGMSRARNQSDATKVNEGGYVIGIATSSPSPVQW